MGGDGGGTVGVVMPLRLSRTQAKQLGGTKHAKPRRKAADPDRPYTPPETHAEYVKRLALETRNYAWLLDMWAAKLDMADTQAVVTVRAAIANLQERLERL